MHRTNVNSAEDSHGEQKKQTFTPRDTDAVARMEENNDKQSASPADMAVAVAGADQPLNFPGRLMRILQSEVAPESIFWLPGGDKFAMHTETVEQVLVNHFQGAKWMSFTRTLNKWGFRKAMREDLPRKVVAYYHPRFLRDDPEQAKQIVHLKKINKRSSSPDLQVKLMLESRSQQPLSQSSPTTATDALASRALTSRRDVNLGFPSIATGAFGRSSEGLLGSLTTATSSAALRGTVSTNLSPPPANRVSSLTQSEQHRLLMEAVTAENNLQETQQRLQIGTHTSDLQFHRPGLRAEYLMQQQLAASTAPARNLSLLGGNYASRSATGNALDQQLLMRHQQLQLSDQRHNHQLLLQAEQRRQLTATAANFPSGSLSVLLQQERQRRQLLQTQLDASNWNALLNTRRASAHAFKEAQGDLAGKQGKRDS